ncbi:MAG: ATP-binding protein [Candidatus Sericytochromatia bacterium]|uniref:ATP-binding protein n=1 Tax=Candidatus Tanganyikabacteria bacterium TaxID=2961651 RepID=A0A938BMX1_9BACT|nr:ATP-binding protein [Candidatus Tanganyikabacteria bacterium]
MPKEINLTIPMIPNMEIAATQTAEAVARFMEFDNDQIDEVKIALIEACINAFEHSHSAEGKVYIKFVMSDNDLKVVIQDFGQGFDPDNVNKRKGWRGNGVKIMRGLMDQVDIDSGPGGTTITMVKARGSQK